MRGKTFILGILMIFIVMGLTLGAGLQTPLPIVVKITIPSSMLADYYEVEIQNIRTGESVRGNTNEHLEFITDWANSKLGYIEGDLFKVTALGITKTIKYTAQPPTELIDYETGKSINIVEFKKEGEIKCPECIYPDCNCPVCEKCPKCECPVCKECPDCNCLKDITPYKECNSCCEDCPECEGTNMNTLIIWILSFFGIGLGTGTYGYKFVVRKRKDTGKMEMKITQHKHKNYERYHSIYTMHKKQPHKRGEINPKYDSYGRYIPKSEGEK